MARLQQSPPLRLAALVAAIPLAAGGCLQPGERATLERQIQDQRVEIERLERLGVQRDKTIADLHRRIEHLEGFGPDRPADLFAPVKIAFASLTGGADYDGKPGDEGVTVYLRLLDADGDSVKAPGRIAIQLLDNTDLAQPRLIGVYRFDDPDTLRRSWYGKFGTQHYTLKCPFPSGAKLPDTGRLTASAEFVDFLTGRTLTATQEVTFSLTRAGTQAVRGTGAGP